MRMVFVTDGKLHSTDERKDLTVGDVYVFSFGSVGEIDYQKEIEGDSNEMEEIALFSHHFSCVAVVGCYTNTKGVKRRSAVVADRGKILGISDMVCSFDGETYKCGSGIRVYETSAGKIGVLVGRDIYFSHLVKSLSACGAEAVVSVCEQLGENVEQLLIRSDAFRYGVPVCMCAHGFAQVADVGGKLLFASPKTVCHCNVEPQREYHLVQTRQKGYYHSQEMY